MTGRRQNLIDIEIPCFMEAALPTPGPSGVDMGPRRRNPGSEIDDRVRLGNFECIFERVVSIKIRFGYTHTHTVYCICMSRDLRLSKEWTDARLTWNPLSFGNLTSIIVKADKLWLPELAVMNG